MKRLDIDSSVEKILYSIFDAALKQSGMPIYNLISELQSYMKEKED